MPRIERNRTSLMQKVIQEETHHPKIGWVDRVHPHSSTDDDANFEIDVKVDAKQQLHTKCPFVGSGSGQMQIPRTGDKVLVLFTESQSNKPIVSDVLWTNTDRPPLGLPGMYKNEFESRESPAGTGNLYMTGFTKYNKDKPLTSPAKDDKDELRADDSVIQIAKHGEGENITPTEQPEVPMKIEMYESAIDKDDEGHIWLDVNQIDQDGNLGLDVQLNIKTGKLHVRGENYNDGDEYEFVLDVKSQTAKIIGDSDAGNKMGASFNFNSNEFSIADGNKFGIESDGSGNFTWSHKSINMKEESGSTGSVNL